VAEEVQRRLSLVKGMHDVVIGGERGRQEVEVVVDRERASGHGLTTAGVGNAVAQVLPWPLAGAIPWARRRGAGAGNGWPPPTARAWRNSAT
jgi:Cu/Ag efflux pump CusA